MRELLKALSTGTNLSAGLIVIATFSILWVLQIDNWLYISLAVVIGLIVGIVIGQSTEFYTSQSYKPTQNWRKAERQVRLPSSFRASD